MSDSRRVLFIRSIGRSFMSLHHNKRTDVIGTQEIDEILCGQSQFSDILQTKSRDRSFETLEKRLQLRHQASGVFLSEGTSNRHT